MDNIGAFLKLIKVYDCAGHTKIRVGNQHDGGYIAYEELCANSKFVYSAGVGNDIGFEKDWVKRWPKANIELFDPYIDSLPMTHRKFTFHGRGLGLRYKPLTHVPRGTTLKMDIEWDEWGSFQKFKECHLRSFNQLLVEFHLVHTEVNEEKYSPYFSAFYEQVYLRINEDLFKMYHEVMKRLLKWFVIFHAHANNSLPLVNLEGYYFPPLLELSLVRRDLVKRCIKSKASFPVAGLDSPNKVDRSDIMDWYPLIVGEDV
jgi:hypothetical protein